MWNFSLWYMECRLDGEIFVRDGTRPAMKIAFTPLPSVIEACTEERCLGTKGPSK